MTPLRFCFVLHVHQPVGNFDHVFREHAADVYRPFLDFLEDREVLPIGLHVSGPLVEWMEAHDTALLDRIGTLVADGRVELLGAGWYEPILVALPAEDRRTQLAWTRERLERRFGVTPAGIWLTERVWEPGLVRDLAAAGVEYVLVDDHLALRAGAAPRDLLGPLRTESEGRYVDLLAIDEQLRYLIPFRPAAEIGEELRRRHAAGEPLALFGDDGEKFGGWPRTRPWLYEQGWLESFGDVLDGLRDDGSIRLVTPAQARAELPARGPVYLPVGSYPEMEEWSGGNWKNFLTRYSEANRLHKRMLSVSRLCRAAGDPHEARRAVGRAQCNDAYWHGVFGGLYMKHLREGVRRELAAAEAVLRRGQGLAWERADLDGDGALEWWVHSDRFSAWVSPLGGGTITELVHFGTAPDLTDVLTRRREAYHEEAVSRSREGGDGVAQAVPDSAPSIHDTEAMATLTRLPAADPEPRTLVVDRVLGGDLDLGTYREGDATPVWSWPPARSSGPEMEGGTLTWSFEAHEGPRVRKTIRVDADGGVEIAWRWDPGAFPADAWFAPELSLGRPAPVELTPPTETWTYPIVTISKCPDGFEPIEQGVSVTPRWPARLGRASLTLPAPSRDTSPAGS